MYQQTKETPVTGFLDPGIKKPRFKRVADAMRRGCKLYPVQEYRMAFNYYTKKGACAMGAAEAGGVGGGDKVYSTLVPCPIFDRPRLLGDVIISLNDRRKWTRERIADWLETLE